MALKIVKLLDPKMCLDCRFRKVATVEAESGEVERMIHCLRLDCDNWDVKGAEPVRRILSEV